MFATVLYIIALTRSLYQNEKLNKKLILSLLVVPEFGSYAFCFTAHTLNINLNCPHSCCLLLYCGLQH